MQGLKKTIRHVIDNTSKLTVGDKDSCLGELEHMAVKQKADSM